MVGGCRVKKLNYQIEHYPKWNNGMYELGTFIESIIIGATSITPP